jgi:hypothetical protein
MGSQSGIDYPNLGLYCCFQHMAPCKLQTAPCKLQPLLPAELKSMYGKTRHDNIGSEVREGP